MKRLVSLTVVLFSILALAGCGGGGGGKGGGGQPTQATGVVKIVGGSNQQQ